MSLSPVILSMAMLRFRVCFRVFSALLLFWLIGCSSAVQRQVSLSNVQEFIGALSWPVDVKKINSPFGKRFGSFHEGIDIGAREGDPVYAAHDGVVVHSGRKLSGYGNMVVLRQGDLMTVYAHNRSHYVKRGEKVVRGDLIAGVGHTGRASGPHLHFETRVKAEDGTFVAVDPMIFFTEK